jgi:hypothetical protein
VLINSLTDYALASMAFILFGDEMEKASKTNKQAQAQSRVLELVRVAGLVRRSENAVGEMDIGNLVEKQGRGDYGPGVRRTGVCFVFFVFSFFLSFFLSYCEL